MYPIRPAASSLGLSPDALDGGVDTLGAANLIERDKETGEIFILDWFRFHHFKTEKSKKMLDGAIGKIASDRLKNLVIGKSKSCLPTTTTPLTPSSSPPPPPQQPTDENDLDPASDNESEVGGGDCFGVPQEFHDTFLRMSKDLHPQTRMNVADEFIGQLLTGKVQKPEGLLRTLVAAANDGTLTLDNARALRKKREAASRAAAIRESMSQIDIDDEACAIGLQFFSQPPGKRKQEGDVT